jgi:hypothetical protein
MILSYILKQKSYILSYSNKITNVIKDLNLINTYQSFGDINNIDYISIDSFKDFNYNDLILSEAIDNGFGIAHDDMTIIVTKIVKKK